MPILQECRQFLSPYGYNKVYEEMKEALSIYNVTRVVNFTIEKEEELRGRFIDPLEEKKEVPYLIQNLN